MGQDTKIQWAHHSFNPWRGCTKVSAGCANCYAETMSKRNPKVLGVWGPRGTRVVAAESYWREPLKWDAAAQAAGERHRVFCASLADWAEKWSGRMSGVPARQSDGSPRYLGSVNGSWDVYDERFSGVTPVTMTDVRRRLGKLIDATAHLDWLLLTKRADRIRTCWREMFGGEERRDNCWLLTSVEDQPNADIRVPQILACRDLAPVLGLSVEPLLGPVELSIPVGCSGCNHPGNIIETWNEHGRCSVCDGTRREPWGIDWVIVGGESGPGARPCNVEWIRSIVAQCGSVGVACFVKQIGARPIDDRHTDILCNGKVHYVRPNADSMCHVASVTPGYSVRPHEMNRLLRDPKGGDPDEWPLEVRVRELPARPAGAAA